MNHIDALTYYIYFGFTIWVSLILIAMVIFCVILARCFKGDASNTTCEDMASIGQRCNASAFIILSILLVVTVFPLYYALRKLRKKSMTLTREVVMLASIFGLFTFTYLTRTAYIFWAGVTTSFLKFYLGLALPILWDVLPIGLMLVYHLLAALRYNRKNGHQEAESISADDTSNNGTKVSRLKSDGTITTSSRLSGDISKKSNSSMKVGSYSMHNSGSNEGKSIGTDSYKRTSRAIKETQ